MEQKKPNFRVIAIISFVLFWLGNRMGTVYSITQGTSTQKLSAALDFAAILSNPLHLSLLPTPMLWGLCLTVSVGLVWLCVKYGKHRLKPAKEYGSARWGSPEDIIPFVDPIPENNLILSDTEKMSLAPRMKVTPDDNYNRNKNILVVGASGSGKSRNIVKPQLLQFGSNLVITDPKGELLADCGCALMHEGFDVKRFNLKDRDQSDHYNFFSYIENEDDILKVTKNLIKNLKEDINAGSGSDPIWEEGMTALLEALIGYVKYELIFLQYSAVRWKQ